MPSDAAITQILARYAQSDADSLGELARVVQDELHQMAAALFRNERPDHTLQPTALVNEVYLRLADLDVRGVVDRHHFFGVASRIMRQILVDHARGRNAAKRGGDGWDRVSLSGLEMDHAPVDVDVVGLDQALRKLEDLNPDYVRLVELRYFAGLTAVEAGELLGISRTEMARRWRIVKAWLMDELIADRDE